jgi:glycosyltransferase involved in cell wall biosynthesis
MHPVHREGTRRIVHVVNTLAMGGAERLVVDLARLQHRAGHTVRVQCLFGSGVLAEELTELGIAVSVCQGASRTGRVRGLVKTFRAHSPDVVHCHNLAATILGAPAARLCGARCVIATRHGGADDAHTRFNEAKFWIAARACSYVVGVSDSTTRLLARGPLASHTRLVTILNGAHAPNIPNNCMRPNQLVLLCVARLAWPKDHATLLRAVAKVRASAPEVQLWLLGDGPDRAVLEELCRRLDLKETVRFLGKQPEVGSWLAQADLFVLSSIAEGAPVALLEALSAGVIPIATAVGGIPEIIERSAVGFVVPPGDDSALAAAIVTALEQRDRWPEWQRRARAAYQRHFTIARMCEQYERLIVNSLARNRR